MKILVLNCGSSSIKYKLFDMDTRAVMVSGGVEKIGLPDSFLQIKLSNGEKVKIEQAMPEHTVGIQLILNSLVDEKIGCIAAVKPAKKMLCFGDSITQGYDAAYASNSYIARLARFRNGGCGLFSFKLSTFNSQLST